jgi:hypothetical protein
MKPNTNGTPVSESAGGAQPAKEDAPKPRSRRRSSSKKAKTERKRPTAEQFELLGRLTYEAHEKGLELVEYVDMMRGFVESYDAVFGE